MLWGCDVADIDKDLEIPDEVEDNFHKSPQFLPPRHDLRKLRIEEDDDVNKDDDDTNGSDPDLWNDLD